MVIGVAPCNIWHESDPTPAIHTEAAAEIECLRIQEHLWSKRPEVVPARLVRHESAMEIVKEGVVTWKFLIVQVDVQESPGRNPPRAIWHAKNSLPDLQCFVLLSEPAECGSIH
jgi:hypothetical protein